MFEPGTFVWCTDHLDVGFVLRNETLDEESELPGHVYMEVKLSCGLDVVSMNDDGPDPDYRPARRVGGVWEYQEGGRWRAIDFTKSALCCGAPTLEDDEGQDLGV